MSKVSQIFENDKKLPIQTVTEAVMNNNNIPAMEEAIKHNKIQNTQNNQNPRQNKKLIEIAATLSGSLTKFSTGILVGWASPSIPKLLSPDSHIPLSSSEGAWVVAAMQAGSILAVFIMAATVDVIGRKRGILFSTIPIIFGWLLLAEAESFLSLCTGRLIGGCGSGYGKIVIGTYIGEIAEPSIRGTLGTFMGITYILGILFSYIVGPLVSIQTFGYVSMSLPVLLFATFIWMPETPYFYLMRGQEERARSQLEKLRGHKMVDEELLRMENGIKKRVDFSTSFKRLFFELKNREPLIIISVLYLSIQFTGKVPILSYCQQIFELSNGMFSSYWSAIITAVVQLIALIFSAFTIDRCGRRLLLIISCVGCALSLGALAVYFYIKDQLNYDTTSFNWLPLAALIVYNFIFNIGLGNIPFIMVGELFSTDVKAIAVCLTSLVLPISSVVNIKLYQIMVDTYGAYTAFSLYAITSVLCCIYSYFRIPETKGKSLEEIQEFFLMTKD